MAQRIIIGDLVTLAQQGAFDVVIHGTNCQHAMGSGVALALATAFPDILAADKRTPKDDIRKLGGYSHAVTQSLTGSPLVICNAYTQRYYGQKHYREGPMPLITLERVCDHILYRLGRRSLRFGYPLIGGDRGNAPPQHVADLLAEKFSAEDATLVLFDEPGRRQSAAMRNLLKQAAAPG